jgi:formate dehydrogenase major subunit
VPGLGTTLGRGGATTAPSDLVRSDCILIQGSSMAEAHPVAFRWVVLARERGATVIHVDPRYSRTSALADLWLPIRAGTDIVLLGALVRHVLENNLWFRDYVVHYTNASVLLRDDFQDTEDLDGLFSGWDPERRAYDPSSWRYAGDDPSRPQRDPTLEHPRCVFSVLRRHFERYTPELVETVCGIPRASFEKLAALLTAASGPEDRRDLLRRRLDAALEGRASHPHRRDPAAPSGKHRPPRRRHPGAARPRLDPGLDRHSHALRSTPRLSGDAARRCR